MPCEMVKDRYNVLMLTIWEYSLASVLLVSLISLIGVFSFALKEETLRGFLLYFISFSAGALFGDVFFHLLPEIVKESGFSTVTSISLLSGIVLSLLIEKVIHWRHCHMPINKQHIHRFALMNLFGDFIHNFIDGLIIGASYLVSIHVGIATTIAVILHEIPQEIGDFGVLIHGGFTKQKALFYNFLTALSAVVGVILTFFLSSRIENINLYLVPFAAGSFIYIAGSDLIPELHKEEKMHRSFLQVLAFIVGILIMMSLLYLE